MMINLKCLLSIVLVVAQSGRDVDNINVGSALFPSSSSEDADFSTTGMTGIKLVLLLLFCSDARKVSQNQGGGKMLENSPVFGSQLKIEEAPGAGKVALECVTGQCATSTVCRPSPPTSPSPMITEWIPVEQSSTSSSTSSSEDQQVSQCGNRGSCNRRGNDEKDFDEIIFDIIKSKKTARSAEDFFGVLIAKHLEQIPMKYRTRVECKLLNVISDAIDLYGIDETKKDGSHE